MSIKQAVNRIRDEYGHFFNHDEIEICSVQNEIWAESRRGSKPLFKMHEEIAVAVEEFTLSTCIWTRSNIDLGGEQKIFALSCNKELPYLAAPPHKSGVSVCPHCGMRIVEEFLSR